MRGHISVSERYGFGDEWLFTFSGSVYMTTVALLNCKEPWSFLWTEQRSRFQLEECQWGGIG